MLKSSAELAARVPEEVLQICQRLAQNGLRAWVVGGCTRDLLLERAVHDWDLATDAQPEQVMRLFRRVIPTGVQHGTVTVMIGPRGYELTTLRGEGAYSDGRHPDSVHFVRDLYEDLARRDFTINAIALDPLKAELSDPFEGCTDLQAKCIRAVGEPLRRFTEDGLRVLRAARFAASLDFEIEPQTKQAMGQALETLRKVSMERVREELLKTLASRQPAKGLSIMLGTGILQLILPELMASVGCEQNHYHKFDVWNHTLLCVSACRADAVLRLAALLHDVAKPATRELSDKTHDYTFYQHELVGARMAEAIGFRLRLSNEERQRVVDLVRHHLVVYEESWSDAAVRRWMRRVGPELLEDVLELARADVRAKGDDPSEQLARLQGLWDRTQALVAQGMALSVRDLALNGRDLMLSLALPPGPVIGQLLEHLLEMVLEDPSLNEKEALLAKARERYQQLSGSSPAVDEKAPPQ